MFIYLVAANIQFLFSTQYRVSQKRLIIISDQAAAVTVFAKESFYFASPKLFGNAAVQGARPRSCGRTLCSSTTPPSAARRPATTSISPWARVAAVAGFMYFSFGPCSAYDTCPVRPHR